MNKVAVITCYKDPDYVRAVTIRQAVDRIDGTELIIIKNSSRGLMRYVEVPIKVLIARATKHPDIYILTFRGYEILPLIRLLTIGRRLVFDEFINLIEWVVYEHEKLHEKRIASKILKAYYKLLLKTTNMILIDTKSHAKFSADLMNLPLSKYTIVPVATDESTFFPSTSQNQHAGLEVLYYGNMLPLHGLDYVCEAAVLLSKTHPEIHFTLIGGKKAAKKLIENAKIQKANIEYISWVDYKDLPKYIQNSDVCLGGPFGDTTQSNMVITGKTYQYLASGIATLIGRNEESDVLTDEANCLIVPQGNPQAIAEKLEWALGHKEELKGIGEKGRMIYEQKLSVARVADILRVVID